jgi:hypothetical protein
MAVVGGVIAVRFFATVRGTVTELFHTGDRHNIRRYYRHPVLPLLRKQGK